MSSIGGGQFEPTLVVKTKSLSLKYLLKSPLFRILVARTKHNHLIYGACIDDDRKCPVVLWSAAERSDELDAIRRIACGEQFMLAMFNEAIANICSGHMRVAPCAVKDRVLFNDVVLAGQGILERDDPEVDGLFDQWHLNGGGFLTLTSADASTWHPNQCIYITNQLRTSTLDLVHADEGGQQEQLAAWITDCLQVGGVFQNPNVLENPPREFCDLLLTHEFGTILFESKALGVLSRSELPPRVRLSTNIKKHIEKALRQLTGACKNLRNGTVIVSQTRREIKVQRELPPHCVVIVPDLTVLNHGRELLAEIAKFASKATAFINIVDPSQLFSLMMDANNLSSRGKTTTPLMAFDYLLIKRVESVIKARDPGLVTLCRFAS